MATMELTAENFEPVTDGGGLLLITKSREIDMDQVRASLATSAAAAQA